MKTGKLFGALLMCFAVAACDPDEIKVDPKLDVDKESLSLTAEVGEASFNVTSNYDWKASADVEWISLDPASGTASDKAVKVSVTAEDNDTGKERTATVTVEMLGITDYFETITVTQAAAEKEEPETYFLVGDAVGGWNFDNPVVLTLTEGYYVAKGVSVTGEKDMHFTKNSSWEGNVKGLHGRIAPDEIGEVGNNNISLTVGGEYDIYLAEALDKFYFMTSGKLPSEAVEHVEIATVWGVCGALEGNEWGVSSDPVMELEGEWYVARNLTFKEINFKVRGNNTWADDLKWGRAAKDQECNINEAIAVTTCSEYKEANPGVGDNENIYINGAGTYDIYFSPENKEVWVMTPGYKPGDEVKEAAELDGYQWLAEVEGMEVLFDFGITEEGMLCIALPTMDGSGFGLFMAGLYMIVDGDDGSGTINFTQYDWEFDEFMDEIEIAYSDLKETSVNIVCEAVFGVSDPVGFERVEKPFEIIVDDGGSEGPSGSIENGDYWFFNGDKVMAPLPEGETSGYLPAVDAADGESTPANLFTLVYDPDMSAYTIQDSYGRYLGNVDEDTDDITLSDELPSDENYVFYYWVVDTEMGDGTYDIYNQETWNGFAYSADDDHWFVSGTSYKTDGVRPTLVKAE